jgi:imidazolonepropionase-like amidohydrolase
VTDGVIQAVGGDLAAWRHLQAIDGAGSTLLPGFIDAHVHMRDGDDLRQAAHREMELLGDAGLTPEEVLTAATMNGAQAFRLVDRGRILPGRRADMVLVGRDPVSDLLSVRDIVRVWKAGVEVERPASVP